MFSVLTHFLRWTIGIDAATTQTTDAERECMVRCARTKKRLAEIGVWEGVTARQIRESMNADAGSVRFTNEAIVCDPKFRIVETVDSLTVLERIA